MLTIDELKTNIKPYFPLILIFLSGFGFSFQTLIIKLLEQNNFSGSFHCVFSRGIMQLIICLTFVYIDKSRDYSIISLNMFGNTLKIRYLICLRALAGFFAMTFSFLSVERMPVGDSNVLVMLSPVFAAIAGYFILNESWRLPEFFATIISLIGASFVVHPSFLFGGKSVNLLGAMFALIAAVSYSAAFILVRILGTTSKMPWANVCVGQAIGLIMLSSLSFTILKQSLTFNISPYNLFLISSGGFIGAWSQIAMTIGMQREKSATASAMRMSDVIFGFMWQMLLTNDKISYLSIIGAALVSTSILIIIISKPINKTIASNNIKNNVKYENINTNDNPMNTIVLDDDHDNSIQLTNTSTKRSLLTKWRKSLNNKFIIMPTSKLSDNMIVTTIQTVNDSDTDSDSLLEVKVDK